MSVALTGSAPLPGFLLRASALSAALACLLLAMGCAGGGGAPSAPPPPNTPPEILRVIPAEPALEREAGQLLSFEVEATDPEGKPLTFEFLLDEERVAVTNRFSFLPDSAGSHQVVVRVSDGVNVIVQQWSVTVTPDIPHPPLASISVTPDSGSAPLQVSIAVSGSDVDGSVVRFQVDADGDGSYEVDAPQPPTLTQLFTAPGTYRVRVRLTDDEGLPGLAERLVRVIPNLPPQATLNVSPSEGFAPLEVRIVGEGSDPEGALVRYELDLDGDGAYEIGQATPLDTVVVFEDYTRTHTLELRVTDAAGMSGTARADVRPRPDVDPAGSTLSQSETGRLLADGRSARRITVRVVDPQGRVLPQVEVELFSSRNGGAAGTVDRISPERGSTGADGLFEADFTTTSSSTLLGDARVSARAGAQPLEGEITVQFFSAVDATKTEVVCPGTPIHVASSPLEPNSGDVTALVRDAQGRALADVFVEFRTRDPAIWPVNPASGRTDASGQFGTTVTSERANDNTFVDVYADGLKTSALCFVVFVP